MVNRSIGSWSAWADADLEDEERRAVGVDVLVGGAKAAGGIGEQRGRLQCQSGLAAVSMGSDCRRWE